MTSISPARQAIIDEACSWIGTPFHHEARVKEAGVDCGQLLIAVYGNLGYMPLDYKLAHYPPDFAMHRDYEWYLAIVQQFAREIEAPGPGDIVLYKWGRLFSHGGIVIDWPEIVHAWAMAKKVVRYHGDGAHLSGREMKFFTPFKDGE